VTSPELPLDITDEVLWRWAKATGKDSAKASAALQQLTPVEYVYKDDPTAEGRVGFIAEDVPAIVANADRFVPYAGGSFSIVLSITARMNPGEFRRILREDGRLLVALPAPEDLIELRGAGRDRVERTVETFAQEFALIERRRVSTTAELDAAAVQDVLHSIYRPMQARPAEAMRVTFSLDLLLFRAAQTVPLPV